MINKHISALSAIIAVVTVSIHLALIYSRTERHLQEFFDRRHEIKDNQEKIKALESQIDEFLSHQKLRDEHINAKLKHVNDRLNR